jgi:2'-5' RNA ligase
MQEIRVFLSLDITDENLLSKIKQIQMKLDQSAAKMKIVELENVHFTWRFFGDTPMSKIEEIHQSLDGLKQDSFDISIQGIGVFPKLTRPRIIWVGVRENSDTMVELKKQTDQLLEHVGYQIERKKFIPHATIARVRFVKDRQRIAQNLANLSDEMIGNMTVSHISMTKSTLTPKGPIYETLWQIQLS